MLILFWVLDLQTEHLTCTINDSIKLLSKTTKKHNKGRIQYFQTRIGHVSSEVAAMIILSILLMGLKHILGLILRNVQKKKYSK